MYKYSGWIRSLADLISKPEWHDGLNEGGSIDQSLLSSEWKWDGDFHFHEGVASSDVNSIQPSVLFDATHQHAITTQQVVLNPTIIKFDCNVNVNKQSSIFNVIAPLISIIIAPSTLSISSSIYEATIQFDAEVIKEDYPVVNFTVFPPTIQFDSSHEASILSVTTTAYPCKVSIPFGAPLQTQTLTIHRPQTLFDAEVNPTPVVNEIKVIQPVIRITFTSPLIQAAFGVLYTSVWEGGPPTEIIQVNSPVGFIEEGEVININSKVEFKGIPNG